MNEQDVLDHDLARAFLEAIQVSPIPVRKASYYAPPFWAEPMNVTRARPVPNQTWWIDFLEIPDKDRHPKIIEKFIATSQEENTVSWRWLIDDQILDSDSLQLTNTVDRHLDRNETNPYPTTWRQIFIRAGDEQRLRLQVLNTSGSTQLCFAGAQGWYYPSLKNTNEIGRSDGMNDQVRNF